MSTADKPDRSFLKRLREETHAAHEATENAVDILGAADDREQYVEMLARLYGLHKPFEEFFARSPLQDITAFDLAARQKSGWLAQDLQFFGMTPETIPLCNPLPIDTELPECLGACYVLEGSSLGGQIIARHLMENLDITPENGGRFFNGYQNDTGAMWRQFGDMLCTQLATPTKQARAIAAANDTFDLFRRWMTQEKPA